MAASAPSPGKGPLSSFSRISRLVYFYRPNDRNPSAASGASPSPSAQPPKLIIVGAWMDAREAHIAKYTTKLQALYPDSPILLVRSFLYHFTTKTRLFPDEVQPAVPVIRSIMGDGGADGKEPQMMVQVFSNGGSTMLRHLYDLYAKSARKGESAVLPPHVTIFDSAPGRWQWKQSMAALNASLTRTSWVIRLALQPVLHLMCALYWIAHVPWRRPGHLGQTYLVHNDRAKNKVEVRRTYIYSDGDKLVDSRDVEEHAALARERGYEVRLEKFRGSAHVAHVRTDEDRYWGIVKSTWEGSTVD